MRIIKTAVCAVIILLLVSCSDSRNTRMFSYQDTAFSVSGQVSTPEGVFSLNLSLSAPDEAGRRSTARLEYTSPESLTGIYYTMSGSSVKACVDDMEIPVSAEASSKLFRIISLFSLNENEITGIKTKDGLTTVSVESSSGSYTVITDSDGLPKSISLTADGSSVEMTVDSFTPRDE